MTVGVKLTSILPPEFKVGVIRLYVLTEARKIQGEIEKDFKATVEDWSSKPKFVKKSLSMAGGVVNIEVFTEDQIYTWVSQGTPPHDIPLGEEKKAFKFPGTYTAKTIPGVLASRPGGRSETSSYARLRVVPNPGIEPRNFEENIKLIWDLEIPTRMQEALDKAARNSGHYLGE